MKILVVDDHPLILDALAHLLPELDPSLEVRGASDSLEAVTILDNEPDVALVLLDLALPGARGLDFLGDLKRTHMCGQLRASDAGSRASRSCPTSRSR